jgi:hypothetical protein
VSTVIVLAPLIIAAWPSITAAVTAAVGTMGFALVTASAARSRGAVSSANRAEIAVEDSEVLEGGAAGESLVVERDGVRATFSRDARGALKVCVEGAGHAKAELRRIGEQLIERVTQQYVYHRVVTELKQRNLAIVEEEVDEDRTIRIRVRNW